jgi:hypothetical protein
MTLTTGGPAASSPFATWSTGDEASDLVGRALPPAPRGSSRRWVVIAGVLAVLVLAMMVQLICSATPQEVCPAPACETGPAPTNLPAAPLPAPARP